MIDIQIYLNNLPKYILSKILLYVGCPISKLIKDEINIYYKDHCQELTEQYRMYYVRNILNFSTYYFDKLHYPEDYMSCYSINNFSDEDN